MQSSKEAAKAKPVQKAGNASKKHWNTLLTDKAEQAALLLQAVVESSQDGIISTNMQGVITSWNTAAERMFGYSPEEIVGESILKIIPAELQKDEPSTLARVAVGERIEHFQTTRLHKNGSRVEVSLSVSPIRNHEGGVIGAAKIARDITQQRLDERSTRQLAAIVDSSDDAIVSKDLNGVITNWNRAAERIFGYAAHEIIGRNVLTIIPPELHSDEPMILGKIRAGDRIEHFETIRLHKNGARIPISLSISPIRDSQGKIVGAAKIARDISQQVNDQQAALRYSALVESSEDAIITKDLDGVITSWNPAAERIFGYAPHEIIGRNVLTIIPKDLQSDEPVILAKIRAGERIEHFQTVRIHKNGTPLDVSLTVSPVRDGGRIVGAAKIVRDVTRQRKMESALHTSERLASVGRLAATIAHEINKTIGSRHELHLSLPHGPESAGECGGISQDCGSGIESRSSGRTADPRLLS